MAGPDLDEVLDQTENWLGIQTPAVAQQKSSLLSLGRSVTTCCST
jgi:hypothetical protein